MIPTKVDNHVALAKLLFTDQFRDATVVNGILDAIIGQVQGVEDAIFDVIDGRILDNATFAQLDSIGDLVGEPRSGRGDTEYREAIRLRIRVNRSKGRALDIIEVTQLSVGDDFTYAEVYPASFVVTAFEAPSPRALRDNLHKAKAAGTYGVLISSVAPIEESFIYDSVEGGVPDARGFGSVYDPSIISRLTTAQEI